MDQQEVTNKSVQSEQNTKMLVLGVLLTLLIVAGIALAMRESTPLVQQERPNQNTNETSMMVEDDEDPDGTNVVVYVETDAQRQARLAAETKLREIEANIQGNNASEETLEAILATRNSLRDAYADAEGEVKESWEETDAQLEILEGDVRDGTASAIDTLQGVLERLKIDIQTDEN